MTKHDFLISKHPFQFCGRWDFMQTPNNCLASLVFSLFSATRGILGGRVGMCSPLSWANIQVSSSQVVMIERPKNVIRPWLSPMESQWHNWQSYYFRKMSLANSRRDVGVGIIMSYFIQLSTFPCLNLPEPPPKIEALSPIKAETTHSRDLVWFHQRAQRKLRIDSITRSNFNITFYKMIITFLTPFYSIKCSLQTHWQIISIHPSQGVPPPSRLREHKWHDVCDIGLCRYLPSVLFCSGSNLVGYSSLGGSS